MYLYGSISSAIAPIYPCDFCLKLRTEMELLKCSNCTETFCIWCVNKPKTVIDIVGDQQSLNYYCSYKCYVESIHDIVPDARIVACNGCMQ